MKPTISLCLIAKDEEGNVEKLFKSIEGCFDEIIFVDTGSTDKTIEKAKEWADKINCPINIQEFEWVKDFAKARNYALNFVHTDYWAWLDLDDTLKNKEAFIAFKDNAMEHADYWLANYEYASNEKGESVCTFARERVIKTSLKQEFKYFLHEGLPPKPGMRVNFITTWSVHHERTAEDLKKDKNRNLDVFAAHKGELDGRMMFYYGKEMFEAGQKVEAAHMLIRAAAQEKLELHDRILALQYACYAFQQCEDHEKPLQLAREGLALEPNRAEFYCIIADSYIKKGAIKEAIPNYAAAKHCQPMAMSNSIYSGPIMTADDQYGKYPTVNLAKCYIHLGNVDMARSYAKEAFGKWPCKETEDLLKELDRQTSVLDFKSATNKTEDIVISCPPQQAYPWDEEIAKHKGMGGSEFAAIQMSKLLTKKTGRKVKIFNPRESTLIAESGVEYHPTTTVNEYFSKNIPKVHIMWRHNSKLTNAKTYAWCHDLFLPTAEVVQNFDKMICLTPFHRDYVNGLQGVPKEKIFTCGNGIVSDRFIGKDFSHKDPNKVVWMSSPDRGLKRCIKVLDLVRKELPDVHLTVYYGLDNLYKYGLASLADELKKMMAERPWITYKGFTQQDEMLEQTKDAAVWLHPCDFIETSCITANETICSGIYPVTRRLGGLKDTLGEFEKLGFCTMLDHDCVTDKEHEAYAKATIEAIKEKKWERIRLTPGDYDWSVIADQWIKEMEL